jgi:hypothetical protein
MDANKDNLTSRKVRRTSLAPELFGRLDKMYENGNNIHRDS